MKGKKLIYVLYQLLKYVLYINIVLAGGVLGFQIINFFRPEKSLITSYLGNFTIELSAKGIFQSMQNSEIVFYFENITGMPSLGINLPLHGMFVLLFTIAVASVTLFYNYKFYKIFEILYASVKLGTPFSTDISKILKSIALFSIGVFVVGAALSIIKLWLIDEIVFNNFVAHPVFDNQLLNFLWFGLGIYILNEIYKVGLELKNEQELTI
jgi:hypothetical protein